jgi:signal recognition particle subunit SEC65
MEPKKDANIASLAATRLAKDLISESDGLLEARNVRPAIEFMVRGLDALSAHIQNSDSQEILELKRNYEVLTRKSVEALWPLIRLLFENNLTPTQIATVCKETNLKISAEEIATKALSEKWDIKKYTQASKLASPILIPNWPKIKQRYLEGNTPADIAKDYGIKPSVISSKAYKERWKEERERLFKSIEDAAKHRIAKNIGGRIQESKSPKPKQQQLALGKIDPIICPQLNPKASKSKTSKNNSSGFRGVSKTRNGKFRAYIWIENIPGFDKKKKQLPLGVWPSAYEAAIAYDCAAIELYHDRAILNFPELHQHEQPE